MLPEDSIGAGKPFDTARVGFLETVVQDATLP
jgi:hypothetical protein